MAKKKQKIMTVTDLYNFCVKNNFCHFSSTDNNEEIHVQMPATFEKESKIDKDKEGLTPFVARAYHDHINLNKSEIKPEVLESTLPSAMLRPILANVVIDEETGEKDFGAHDFVIEYDENDEEIVRYLERPVGVIFGDNTIEYDEKDDVNRAILHGYLFDGYCQDAVDIMNRRKTVDCSVELSVREMSFNAKDKVLTLDDFYVSGLTLLGSKINPGMRGSKVTIEDFCDKKNSLFSKDDKLVEVLEKLNTTLSSFNINNQERKEEQFVETKNFEEVVEGVTEVTEETVAEVTEEVVEENFEETTEESTEEVVAEETSEETTEESTEVTPDVVVEEEISEETEEFAEDTTVESVEAKPEKYAIHMSDGSIKEFELTLDDITYAIYNLVNSAYSEADNTYYYVSVYENNYVIMHDYWNGKSFKQNFSREGDNFTLTGDRIEVFANWLTAEEEATLTELRANYTILESQLKEYKLAEENAQKDALFVSEDYSSIATKDEFKVLAENHAEFSVDELKAKLDAIILEYAKKGTLEFSVKAPEKKKVNRVSFGMNMETPNPKDEFKPYGDLFDK